MAGLTDLSVGFSNDVAGFFNRNAEVYARYSEKNLLHRIRREIVISELRDFDGNLLDIGAGPAKLYDLINPNQIHYRAIDISPEMKKISNVPDEQYFVGDITALTTNIKFSGFTILGVSSYLPCDIMKLHLDSVLGLAKPGSMILIQFANRHSLWNSLVRKSRPLLSPFLGSGSVMGSSLPLTQYTLSEIEDLHPKFSLIRVHLSGHLINRKKIYLLKNRFNRSFSMYSDFVAVLRIADG